MYGSPYINPQNNIDRINQQIQELEKLKTGYQNIPQQPMNVFNVGATNQVEFEAKYVGDNEIVEDIPIQRKTAFISVKNRYLKVKELNGDITTYEIVTPKDEKDIKIEELERRLKEYEQSTNANNEVKQQKCYDSKSNKDKS